MSNAINTIKHPMCVQALGYMPSHFPLRSDTQGVARAQVHYVHSTGLLINTPVINQKSTA